MRAAVKVEGACARNAGPLCAHLQHRNSAVETDEVKRLSTATAKLALAGFSLYPLEAGAFLVTRWNLSRQVADLDGVEQFLRRVAP